MISIDTGTLFLALLAVVAQAAVLGVVGLAVAALAGAGGARRALAAARQEIADSARWLAAGVAGVATVGSLWLSEGAGFPPCRLCWVQRAAMYPLVVLLPLAAARRGSPAGERTALVAAGLAVAGGATSIWHMLIERFPSLEGASSCDPANPCSVIWVERFGYLTIPTMALSGFALVLTLLALSRPTRS